MADVAFVPHQQPKGRSWSLFSWTPTSVTLAQAAENRLLSRFQYFKPSSTLVGAATPQEAREAVSETTELSTPTKDISQNIESAQSAEPNESLIARVGLVDVGDGQMINTLVIDRTDDKLHHTTGAGILRRELSHGSGGEMVHLEQDVAPVEEVGRTGTKKKTLVMAHGYGAGLGFFYRNFAGLSDVSGWRIYAIDWLGMANSSRPSFPKLKRGVTDDEIVEDAEAFFVESLEKWREANGIDSMTLMGHSLGGYLSACYALKHPERVEKLVLVSPAGVGKIPEGQEAALRRRGFLPALFTTLWSWNVTPMSVIRTMGPWGPSLVRKYTSRRFAYLDQSDADDLHSYIYHISAQTGSGEFALARLLLPGAWARKPLHDRLANLKMPTTFLYGAHDWMDYHAAMSAVQGMKVPTRIARVSDSGHHLYLDNPMGFNNAMIAEMVNKDVARKGVEDVEYVHVNDRR
ncbi:hypothetical protein SpCBS45565_g07698 [Spizellomyces sp. 'palustris']|nr:hypothetical protein SpCBS45565_g07698 [Spizellomyces sp. 'palustris']